MQYTVSFLRPWRQYKHKRHRLWFVSIERSPYTDKVNLTVNVLSFLKLAGILAVVGYFAGGFALHSWLARNPFNRVELADLWLPWRWRTLQDLRGQAYIAEGLEDLKAKRYGDGIWRVRVGLLRHPHDPIARMTLAKLYADAGVYDAVKTLMMPELALAQPPARYVAMLLEEATKAEDHSTILEICNRMLASPGLAADERYPWLLRKAIAQYALLQYDEALRTIEDPLMRESSRACEIRVRALCGLHRGPEALNALNAWKFLDREQKLAGQLRVLVLQECSRFEEMEQAVKTLEARFPTDLEVRVFGIGQLWDAGRRDAALRELHDCLFRFESDFAALDAVAEQGANASAPAWVRACVDSAAARGRPTERLLSLLAMAQVGAGDWSGAEESSARLFESQRKVRAEEIPLRDWLHTVILAARAGSPTAEKALAVLFEHQRFTLPLFKITATGLARTGCWPGVMAVADAGLAQHAGNTELLRWRQRAVAARTASAKAGRK